MAARPDDAAARDPVAAPARAGGGLPGHAERGVATIVGQVGGGAEDAGGAAGRARRGGRADDGAGARARAARGDPPAPADPRSGPGRGALHGARRGLARARAGAPRTRTPRSRGSPTATSRGTARRPTATSRCGRSCPSATHGPGSPRSRPWTPATACWTCRTAPRPAPLPTRLLGNFDPILHGWVSRDPVLGAHERDVVQGGIFRSWAFAGGRAVGLWRIAGGRVRIAPFAPLAKRTEQALLADADGGARLPRDAREGPRRRLRSTALRSRKGRDGLLTCSPAVRFATVRPWRQQRTGSPIAGQEAVPAGREPARARRAARDHRGRRAVRLQLQRRARCAAAAGRADRRRRPAGVGVEAAFDTVAAGGVVATQYASAAAARSAIDHQRSYAALARTSTDTADLLVSSASGPSVSRVLSADAAAVGATSGSW